MSIESNPSPTSAVPQAGMPQQAAPPYTPPYPRPASPPQPPRPARTYHPRDAVLSIVLILLSTMLVHTVRLGGGIGLSLFFAALFITGFAALKKEKKISGARPILLLLIGILLSSSFTLFSPTFISVCAFLFLGIMLALWAYTTCMGTALFRPQVLLDGLKGLFLPFTVFGSLFIAFRAFKNKGSKRVAAVLIGVALALPLTIVVGALLFSADAAFAKLLTDFFSDIGERLFHGVLDLALCVPLALYLHALVIADREKATPEEAAKSIDLTGARILPTPTAYTIMTPVIVLYVLFLIVQSGYFFSAFSGLIPEGISYSDYARRGFFELCSVAAINLLLLSLVWLLCRRKENGGTPKALRLYGAVLSLLTLLLIAVALSKMVMYMQFGLTLLRVYTTWFMALLALLFLLILLKMLIDKLPLARLAATVAAVMIALLSMTNINAMVAQYNVDQYLYTTSAAYKEFDFDYLESLGDAAIPAIARLTDTPAYGNKARRVLEQYAREHAKEKADLLTFTLDGYLAEQAADAK
ncbi:MAG: DUF4173 domain-containing protein [Clostridia bacterium]|nr:DUF4173 domain-containing protein [Clostridia bacterium]